MLAMAGIMIGCQPVNPPSNDDISTIINLCYTSMGQSGKKLQHDLADLGISIPQIDSTREYENYYIKNSSYELAFSTINDSVLILRYKFYFKNNYVEGANKYLEVSDMVFLYGWDSWTGDAHNSFEEIEERPSFVAEVKEWVSTWNKAQLMLNERCSKPLASEKVLCGATTYWASSEGGIKSDIGEGNSSLAESEIGIEFRIR